MRVGRLLFMAAVTLLFLAPSAHAAFHLMKVSEVFPGTNANVNTAFIELQMFAAGQNFVVGHDVDYYTANGTLLGSAPMNNNVGNGESQRKILVGDTEVNGATPDFVHEQLGDALHAAAAGGAVCFSVPGGVDCVSWGNFTGQAMLPGAAGTPLAGAIADGMSITRSTAPGCPNLFESSDDTDNSSVDFSQGVPNPENNSSPLPTGCGDGGNGDGPPTATIDKVKVDGDDAKVKFSADQPNATFECKLDEKPYKSCTSPKKYKNLDDGKHKLKVRATNADGERGKADKAKIKI